MRIAAIEIGTNSTKFIVAEPIENTFRVLEKSSIVNRLSKKMYGNNQIAPEAFESAFKIIGELTQKCNHLDANLVSIFSTSVLREAANRDEFINAVNRQFGINIEVIDGEREAYYAYKACSNLIKDAGAKFGVIDIGGGSTEITIGNTTKIEQKLSLPLGAVRLTELFLTSDPVKIAEIKQAIDYTISNLPEKAALNLTGIRLLGTGGTVKTIGTIFLNEDYQNETAVDGVVINKTSIEAIYSSLLPKNLSERQQVNGLNPKRADVIIAGLIILITILNIYGLQELTISSQGVLEGFIGEYLSGVKK